MYISPFSTSKHPRYARQRRQRHDVLGSPSASSSILFSRSSLLQTQTRGTYRTLYSQQCVIDYPRRQNKKLVRSKSPRTQARIWLFSLQASSSHSRTLYAPPLLSSSLPFSLVGLWHSHANTHKHIDNVLVNGYVAVFYIKSRTKRHWPRYINAAGIKYD